MLWKKLNNEGEFRIINVNSLLLRFTGDGEPVLPIPVGSNDYKLYSIESVEGIAFELKEYATGINSSSVYTSEGIVSKNAVYKSVEFIVRENIWWYKNEEDGIFA